MRILISSHRYAPDVGGIETVSGLLAAEWRKLGHEVHVVTQTPAGDQPVADEAHVHRRPSARRLLGLVRRCDIYWHSNISLQTAWPLLFVRRPWFITPNTWLHAPDGRPRWRDALKRWAHRRARNLYPSAPLAAHVALPGERVCNPYESEIFRPLASAPRDQDLVFVGRLVSDKGADLLLQALARLAPNERPRLTVVGRGPEEPALRALADQLGLADRLHWAGTVQDAELAALLNRHRVLVAPSRWAEPFGLVALLGLACGCRVVVADTGGLPEAAGPDGVTFAAGDVAALTATLAAALAAPVAPVSAATQAHLARYGAPRVAARYLELFEAARKGTAG